MKGIGRVGPIVAFNPMQVLGCMACFALPALADSDPNACRETTPRRFANIGAPTCQFREGFGR
jgi:hypothetical protein